MSDCLGRVHEACGAAARFADSVKEAFLEEQGRVRDAMKTVKRVGAEVDADLE